MSQRALTELLRGKEAHADPLACIEDIPAELATTQIYSFPHSIGQPFFHMNYWMSYELRRIRGEEPSYPEHNAESFPSAPSPANTAEWDRLRRDFAWFLNEYATLAELSRAELDRQIESVHEGDKLVAGSVEAVLWQMAVHNSYHIGQIALIRRVLGAWPPKAGGDTW